MALGGYANRIGHIDLSQGKVAYEPIPEDWARKYIGGRGLGVKYVFENGPQVEPLSPDNILCFMNGPLTGSEANMSGGDGGCHQITAHRNDRRQPSWWLVCGAPALGWFRWLDIQRKSRKTGLRLRS